MALVSNTGLAGTPGTVRKTDTTIQHATIDNTSWGYPLRCQVSQGETPFPPLAAGIYGADVVNTISSGNG